MITNQHWVSVIDKMPKNGQNVLAYVPMYDKIIVAYHYNGVWSDTIPKIGDPYWKVTHWMELPNKPVCK